MTKVYEITIHFSEILIKSTDFDYISMGATQRFNFVFKTATQQIFLNISKLIKLEFLKILNHGTETSRNLP